MRLIIKLLVLITIVSFYSCKTVSFIDCIGVYHIQFRPGYSKLELKQDSTFSYFIANDLAGEKTYTGTWKKEQSNNVILHQTFPKLESFNDKGSFVEEKYIKGFDSIKVQVLFEDSIVFIPVNISFNNNEQYYITNILGIITTDRTKIKNINLESLLGSYEYKVKNNRSNSFIFNIYNFDNIPLLDKQGIVPLKWKCYKDSIQPINNEGKKINEIYKRKL